VYGDTIVHAPLQRLLTAHVAAGADATIAVTRLEGTDGKGLVEPDDEGLGSYVTSSRSRAGCGWASQTLVSM
jgi:NDP-sugar pyrophosphorylase family protein